MFVDAMPGAQGFIQDSGAIGDPLLSLCAALIQIQLRAF